MDENPRTETLSDRNQPQRSTWCTVPFVASSVSGTSKQEWQEAGRGLPGAGGREWTTQGDRGLPGLTDIFCSLVEIVVTQLYTLVKNPSNYML